MFVKALRLQNFRNYDDIQLQFDQPRTLIVGENGVGKSTIVDAIALALTGRCRGVDGKGQGQKDLIRSGADEATITLVVDGLGDQGGPASVVRSIGRNHAATSTMPVDMILGRLRTTEHALTAAIYGSAFFDLHHAEAKSLLMQLLNVKVDVKGELLSLDEVDLRYQVAFDNRAAAKRTLAATPEPAKPALRTDLEQLNDASLAMRKIEVRDVHEAAVRAAADLQAQLRDLVAQVNRLAKRPSVATLEANLTTHRDLMAKHQASLTAAEADLATLTAAAPVASAATLGAQAQEVKLFMSRIEATWKTPPAKKRKKVGQPEEPPMYPICVLGNNIPCMTSSGEFTRAMNDARAELKRLEQLIADGNKAAEAMGAAREAVSGYSNHVAYHSTQVDDITKQLVDAGKLDEQAAAAAAEITRLGPEAEAADAAIARARTAVDEVTTKAADLKAYRDAIALWEASTKQVEHQKAVIADLEESVALLGPKGLRLKALKDALGDFHAAINGALGAFGFTIEITPDPWDVKVTHGGGRVSYDLLSKGQKIWTGMAFQCALAAVSRLDFFVVDDVEGVVGRALQMLTGIVMTAPVGQILVVKAQPGDQEPPDIEGLQVIELAPTIAWMNMAAPSR